jgi:hypothetical protein
LLVKWQKSQRDEPAKQSQPNPSQPHQEGPGWMTLQPIKRDPKPPLTDHDLEVLRKAKEAVGMK